MPKALVSNATKARIIQEVLDKKTTYLALAAKYKAHINTVLAERNKPEVVPVLARKVGSGRISSFSAATKKEAVEDVLLNRTTLDARAKGLGITPNGLRGWIKQYQAQNGEPEKPALTVKLLPDPVPVIQFDKNAIEAKLAKLKHDTGVLEEAQRILNGKN